MSQIWQTFRNIGLVAESVGWLLYCLLNNKCFSQVPYLFGHLTCLKTYPKVCTSLFFFCFFCFFCYFFLIFRNCWMIGKQCRPVSRRVLRYLICVYTVCSDLFYRILRIKGNVCLLINILRKVSYSNRFSPEHWDRQAPASRHRRRIRLHAVRYTSSDFRNINM